MGTTMDKSVSGHAGRIAAAWNRHDIDALMSFMSEDCVFLTVAGPDQCGTRDPTPCAAPSRRPGRTFRTRSGATAVTGSAAGMASESTFTGTAADGSRVEADMVDVFTFKNERQDPGQERLPQAAPGLAGAPEAAAAPTPQGAQAWTLAWMRG